MEKLEKIRRTFCFSIFTLLLSIASFSVSAQGVKENSDKDFRTTTIGDQQWMAENLDVGTFRNGDPIPEVRTAEQWEAAYRGEKAAWCYYGNNPTNGKRFGRLYNWYAVNDPRGLAPAGWHIPSNKEWQVLIAAVGGESSAFSRLNSTKGFSALPGGERYYKDCSFYKLDEIGFWWSSTSEDTYNAWYFAMHFGLMQVVRDNGGMNTGFSVRCIMN
jgi:uncharacterized protein (TIGR02145 family)